MKKVAIDITEKIRRELRKTAKLCSDRDKLFVLKYLGTKKKYLCVKATDRDKLLREVLKETRDVSGEQLIAMLDELFFSGVYDYTNFASKFLTKSKKARKSVSLSKIEKWVIQTEGWAECDSICQSLMSEKEVFERWSEWQKSIKRFSDNKNIQLRRASLVLQVKSARESNDPNLRKLAFQIIEKLKSEKDILITKAISWLLRDLSRQNKKEVLQYLKDNQKSLPKIAFRETMRKIATGKK